MANATARGAAPRPITRETAQLVLRRMPGLAAVVVMAVIGIVISIYLTSVHYAKVPLVCSASGTIDCASVLKSPYGLVPGTQIPITFPGMLWFVVSGGIAAWVLLAAMRGTRPPTWWSGALQGWGILGLLSILYLVYAEIVKLHHICAWCTIIHTLVLATLIVAYMQDTTIPTLPNRKSAGKVVAAKPTNTTTTTSSAKSAAPSRPLNNTARPASRPLTGAATKPKTPVSATTKKAR
ncbi:MAG: vitamin K epoxide reductase family protein [Ktedonobacterales bacterium]|nr:vitamin K epoxide reductase family protein [Ktedonobacterales bacterium]